MPESRDPHLGIQALADEMDRLGMEAMAESVRDWMVERDGTWREFARGLADQIRKLPSFDPRRRVLCALRAPKSRICKAVELREDGSRVDAGVVVAPKPLR